MSLVKEIGSTTTIQCNNNENNNNKSDSNNNRNNNSNNRKMETKIAKMIVAIKKGQKLIYGTDSIKK